MHKLIVLQTLTYRIVISFANKINLQIDTSSSTHISLLMRDQRTYAYSIYKLHRHIYIFLGNIKRNVLHTHVNPQNVLICMAVHFGIV